MAVAATGENKGHRPECWAPEVLVGSVSEVPALTDQVIFHF